MAQNWHQWRALVNIVLNIRLPKMLGSSWVAAQLAAPEEELSSVNEWMSEWLSTIGRWFANAWLPVWFQHHSPPPRCRRGRQKIILDSGLVANMKLQFPGPHARLTLILSISSARVGADIWKPKCVPIQSLVERNCVVEFNDLQME
jgi:hypothetical protein